MIWFSLSLTAQTKVIKVNASKTNDYGVRYVLPKTLLQVQIEYSEMQQKAGVYAQYAAHYLGVNDEEVIHEDQTLYTLDQVTINELGVPNKEQSYLIAFKSKTTAPFVYLTEEGLICAINAEPEIPKAVLPVTAKATENLPQINPQSIYTSDYLQAGSIRKKAELAAKSIYAIRESRHDLLTGELENVPKDGEAMKIILGNLNAQEKLWTELFMGTSTVIKHTKEIRIEPNVEVKDEILFRFSKRLGVVDADDLSGSPVYWNLTDLKTVEILPVDPKKKVKESTSMVYNIPGKAEALVVFNNRKWMASVNVTQFGTTDILETSMLEDKKAPVRIFFYPLLGALKQIIQ
jgi:hypothetical protein